ncbi:nucleotidyltransferase family protein [Labilibaculum euxinus]
MQYYIIKKDFRRTLRKILNENILFRNLLYEIFVHGSAYVVGGFLRDIITNRESRDLDIIVDVDHNCLLDIIKETGVAYSINRHKGIKLKFETIEVDMWSIENNWAFKNRLVRLNEDKKLASIAKGCFYNYDSLVINLHSNNMNIQYYKQFMITNELDILQKNPIYKNLNPTKEANILRAFYLRKIYEISYSANTKSYLLTKIGEIKDNFDDPLEVLIKIKRKYPKYEKEMSDDFLKSCLLELINNNTLNDQLFFKI